MLIKQHALLATLSIAVLVGYSCTRDVTLKINDEIPPAFTFDRNYSEVDRLLLFVVEEIASDNANVPYLEQAYEKNKTIWKIKPISSEDGVFAKLSPITYGNVPVGFIQEIPEDGTPAALEEGKVYEAGGPYVMMNRARVRFIVRDGRVVQVATPEPH